MEAMTPAQQSYNRVYAWIASSETNFHFLACDVLIELFKKQYPDEEVLAAMLNELKKDLYFDFKRNKHRVRL